MDEEQRKTIINPKNEKDKFQKVGNYITKMSWKIGEGSYSEVFRGVDEIDQSLVAVKVIDYKKFKNQLSVTLLQQQVQILQCINHPNLVKCKNVIPTSHYCYIINEFCEFGDFESILKIKIKFKEQQISKFIFQMYQGLRYLSDRNIIHRDLKPANILLQGNNVCKISDFGFAIKNPEGKVFKDVGLGSPVYMTPQAMHMGQFGPKTDVWAFGCIIYQLIEGHSPFWIVRSPEQLKEKVFCPIAPLKEKVSHGLLEFLQRCLCVQVNKRISFQQMENTDFIRTIAQQIEAEKNSMDESQTKSSKSCRSFLSSALKNSELSYSQAVAIMKYCRLTYKLCRKVPSQLMQNWLVQMISVLKKTPLRANQPIDYKNFQEVVDNFYDFCKKNYKKVKQKINIETVIVEFRQLLKKQKRDKDKQLILLLESETIFLQRSQNHPLKFFYYVKNSKASQYLIQHASSS